MVDYEAWGVAEVISWARGNQIDPAPFEAEGVGGGELELFEVSLPRARPRPRPFLSR